MSIIKNSFDNIPLGMCIFDENGRLRLCNRRMHYIAGILLNGSAFTLDDSPFCSGRSSFKSDRA